MALSLTLDNRIIVVESEILSCFGCIVVVEGWGSGEVCRVLAIVIGSMLIERIFAASDVR